MNKKRVRRLYRLEGLQLRHRLRRRKHMALHRGAPPPPTDQAQRWSMDFVHDQLFDGRPFRVLTLIDHWNRESVLLEPAFGFRGACVATLLDEAIARAGPPSRSRATTAPNSRPARSKRGPTNGAFSSISADPVNPRITGTSSPSTAGCGTSV